MKELIYPHEKTLFTMLLVLAVVAWLAIIVGTLGIALIFVAIMAVVYLFAQSRFIAYFHGTGAVVTKEQFPDLYQAYEECCRKLEMDKKPTLVLMHMDGMFNAFATRFLRKHYVILLSDIVDALADEPESLKFYMGHELGHIKRKHLGWMPILSPVSWLPLIGSGYSRACEYTCDRHGRFCCNNEQSAVKAMAALSVGATRWKTLNVPAYLKQKELTKGFWMSLHEITSDYPWLVKRIAKLHVDPTDSAVPRRNPFAWILGIFIPRFTIMSLFVIYALIAGPTIYMSIKKMKQFGDVDMSALDSAYEGDAYGYDSNNDVYQNPTYQNQTPANTYTEDGFVDREVDQEPSVDQLLEDIMNRP